MVMQRLAWAWATCAARGSHSTAGMDSGTGMALHRTLLWARVMAVIWAAVKAPVMLAAVASPPPAHAAGSVGDDELLGAEEDPTDVPPTDEEDDVPAALAADDDVTAAELASDDGTALEEEPVRDDVPAALDAWALDPAEDVPLGVEDVPPTDEAPRDEV